MMSNKPHLHPHQKKQQARRTTRLLVAILVLAVFALAIALEMTGHVVFRGRLILSVNPPDRPTRRARSGRRGLFGPKQTRAAATFIDSSSTRSRPPAAGLYLFSDFHESLLDKLDHPGPGIGVDLDPREQILIPPVVASRGRAA